MRNLTIIFAVLMVFALTIGVAGAARGPNPEIVNPDLNPGLLEMKEKGLLEKEGVGLEKLELVQENLEKLTVAQFNFKIEEKDTSFAYWDNLMKDPFKGTIEMKFILSGQVPGGGLVSKVMYSMKKDFSQNYTSPTGKRGATITLDFPLYDEKKLGGDWTKGYWTRYIYEVKDMDYYKPQGEYAVSNQTNNVNVELHNLYKK